MIKKRILKFKIQLNFLLLNTYQRRVPSQRWPQPKQICIKNCLKNFFFNKKETDFEYLALYGKAFKHSLNTY